ncbi:MAG: tetratricopeptide repeat-containing sulfotransferase family protein [Sphingomicrobium sp.]
MATLARRGAAGEALQLGTGAINQLGDPAPVHALIGRLACENGDLDAGIAHLRVALEVLPDDFAVRCDLVAALTQTGAVTEALATCDRDRALADPSLQLARFRGYLAQEAGDFATAIEAYRHVVDRAPADFAAWNNLGNALSGAEDYLAAIEALREAARIEPLAAPTRINLATALTGADRTEEAIEALRQAAADFPDDPKPWVELAHLADRIGRADMALESLEEAGRRAPRDPEIQVDLGNHRGTAWDMAGAEQGFRAAIAADPAHGPAYVALAVLFEHDNRVGELPALVKQARAARVAPGALAMVEAYAFRRAKQWDKGLVAAAAASDEYEPVRRAQLIGEFRDRLGDAAGAFASFEDMNRLAAVDPREPNSGGQEYRDMVDRNRATIGRLWLDGWTPPAPPQPDERASPIILLGFPRSGTTLLDTILMGHPGVQVYEERPALVHVEHGLGGIDALPTLDAAGVRGARDDYWNKLAAYAPLRDVPIVIDKMPLYLNKTAVIHRLFPDARFILALRHPMDVVLSCFITNFRPNPAMSNFHDLVRAAELYDRSMAAFAEARALLDLPVFTVAYERMVADRDAELRPLFDWLGLDWRLEALDHQATAAKRGIISTASYAQVHEPLYARSAGRWTRYRDQLKPVEGILAPWIERFGYSLDDPTKLPRREAA